MFAGLVFSNPALLAKLMSLFIYPDSHELSLLGSMPKQAAKKNAMPSSAAVKQRIKMMLSQHTEFYPTCASDEVVNMTLSMMEGLKFMIPITFEESDPHVQLTESFILIPSLRPVTKFRWNFLQKDQREGILTFGRRVKSRNSKFVHPAWFSSIQVRGNIHRMCD